MNGVTVRGFSLLECLVAIALLSLVSALTARSTQLLSTQLAIVSSALEQRLATTKALSILSASLHTLDGGRRPEAAIISSGSDLRAPHGGPHPLVGLGASSKPRAESAILSVLDLDPRYQGRIVEGHRTATGITVTVCGTHLLPSPERFKSHLLLGLEGACQVTGSAQRISAQCFSLTGTAVRGLLHQSSACPYGSFHEYTAVSSEFSLFVDRSGEFRLASHLGMRILENQPITRGLRELRLSWIEAAEHARFLAVGIRGASSPELRALLPVSLARTPRWNEVLL